MGIRGLGLSDGGFPAIRFQSQIRGEAAINAILDDWQFNRKVTLIKIVRGGRKSYGEEIGLESLLRERQILFEFVEFGSPWLETELHSANGDTTTAITLLSSAASLLSVRAPEVLSQLLSMVR